MRTALELGASRSTGSRGAACSRSPTRSTIPQNVDALILSNTYACGKDYLLDISDHRVSLGSDMHAAMLKHEQAGTMDDPEYQDAVAELYARYLYRSSPYDSARSREEFEEIAAEYMPDMGPAYALWGPHEFMGTGPEAHFDISDRLGEIRCRRSCCAAGTTSSRPSAAAARSPTASPTASSSSSASRAT